MRPAFAPLILEQLVHDAPFAWYLWNLAAVSPVLRAGDLAELDRRLDAYLDVAEIAGADARSPSAADRGALFVRALLALRAGDREALGHALVDLQRPAQVDELADALVRVGTRGAAAAIPALLDNPAPLVRAAALHAARRCNLRLDERLGAHLADPHPQVLAAALRLVGDTRRRAFLPWLPPHLDHPDDEVRYQTARAGVLLGAPAAVPSLDEFLYGESPYLRDALLLRYADASAADWTSARMIRSSSTSTSAPTPPRTFQCPIRTGSHTGGKHRPPPSALPSVTWLGKRLRPKASSLFRTAVRRPRLALRDSISRCPVRIAR